MQLWEISRNWSHLIVWPLPQNIFKTLAFRFSPAPYNIYCLSVWTKSSFDILGFGENSENCLNSLMCRCWDTLIKWSPDGQTERQAVLLASLQTVTDTEIRNRWTQLLNLTCGKSEQRRVCGGVCVCVCVCGVCVCVCVCVVCVRAHRL